ncbi:hypothetical protein PHYSODRAFT_336607 [Phytophthora sojae]|uniref:Uncharacterized protein n=1 Tax=Phytophthora sojae (strain P6497) TaxID=1094619 RepID=G4ZYW0_PHYSP|nr:hypothetical protein PHYSODRAFT_336607 [Phytophthora sojae]EGZ12143.1 hypothetical protein PHYSODRAFT_336607 [Phytophthora sojae]|eukprot:XP_009532476.1 hypothetical protein PHYSODRAFT_336607 [Phytophthora sojae]
MSVNLHQQLAHLQTKNDDGDTQRDAALGLNSVLKGVVEQQQLGVASAQSLVSQWLQNQERNPMGFSIHLGREWAQRREVLLSMKDERIARGLRYVTAHCQHLDALRPHFSEERFEDASGDFCCVRNEVIPFPGVQSMRKVFDAVKFTLDTLEINISEQLGHITVRDDYDANGVAFGHYFERSSEDPYAVLTIDSVDQDDLHPYHPHEHVRKKVTGDNNSDVTVVMLRSFFVKTCRPDFEVSEQATQELQDTVTGWGDDVFRAVRKIVYA